MPHDEGFLRAIRESPDDDALRLVYADWLEENGQPKRAEFIRLSCALSPLRWDDPRRKALERREKRLLKAHGREWLGPLRNHEPRPSFNRGLPVCIVTPGKFITRKFQTMALEGFPHAGVQELLLNESTRQPADVFNSPILAQLHTLRWHNSHLGEAGMKALADCPHLANLVELAVDKPRCGDTALRRLARSPHLRKLKRLELSGTSFGPRPNVTVAGVRALLDSPRLASLDTLGLPYGWWGHPPAALRRLVSLPGLARLRKLALACCLIDDDGARILAASEHLAGLEELGLYGNNLRDDGARALLESPHLTRLRRLTLHSWHIDPALTERLRERFGAGIIG